MNFEAFKSSIKYISCYEMAWKLTFIIHQHVIEHMLSRKWMLFIEDFHLMNSYSFNIIQPIEHYFFIKWFLKWVLCLVALSFKISRLWNCWMIWFFIKFIQWTYIFIEGDIFLLYKKFEINCMTLCLPFDYFKKKCTLNTWFV